MIGRVLLALLVLGTFALSLVGMWVASGGRLWLMAAAVLVMMAIFAGLDWLIGGRYD